MLGKLTPDLHVLHAVIVKLLHPLVKVVKDQILVINERPEGFELLGERSPHRVDVRVGDVDNDGEMPFEASIHCLVSKQSSQNFRFNPGITTFCTWLRSAIREPSEDEVFGRLVVAAEQVIAVGDVADDPIDRCDGE